MRATEELHELGQSIWLDNITREMLDSGQLRTYIDDYSVTGLTSNPSIFDKAIARAATTTRSATRPRRASTASSCSSSSQSRTCGGPPTRSSRSTSAPHGVDGWVSLEVSPLLAYDTETHREGGEGAPRAGGAAQPLHQDPGHAERACPPSRRRSLPACRSTSPCSSPPTNTSLLPRRSCAASSGASRRSRTRSWARSPRSSCRAGTSPCRTRCPST